jgi:hypothetical protein
MPSYRFRVAIDEMCEDDLSDLYSFIDWESKSGDWDTNTEDPDGKRWWGARFERKAEAIYFKTRFNTRLVEWDESGTEPSTVEELLEQGYVHGTFRVADDQCRAFEDWCEAHNFGVVDEIKFGGRGTWPYNIYAPNEALLQEAQTMWAAPTG